MSRSLKLVFSYVMFFLAVAATLFFLWNALEASHTRYNLFVFPPLAAAFYLVPDRRFYRPFIFPSPKARILWIRGSDDERNAMYDYKCGGFFFFFLGPAWVVFAGNLGWSDLTATFGLVASWVIALWLFIRYMLIKLLIAKRQNWE